MTTRSSRSPSARRPRPRWATVLLMPALALVGCSDSTEPDTGSAVRLEGTVTAIYGEGPVAGAEITVDVLGAGGARGWATAVSDSSGGYALEVTVPGGCDADSVDAVVRAAALDHERRVRGGPGERLRLTCAATTSLDLELYRTVFRAPQPVAGGLVPTQLSVGREHACAITDAGAYCWGASWYGRLGNASETGYHGDYAASPVAVTNGQSFVRIAAGNDHTCALDDTGAAWCWGGNSSGQVGADTSLWQVDEPYRVQTDLRFEQIVAGRWFSCGLTAAGAVYCWGDARGVGTGEPIDTIYTTPQPVILDGTYVRISSIFSSACALRDDGEAYCWGFSYRGELGGGEDPGQHPTPVPVAGGHSWSDVDAGVVYGCGVTTAGSAYCWGSGDSGQLGYGGTGDRSDGPVAVAGGHTFSTVRAGTRSTCALDATGTAYCWGANGSGELGTPAAEDEACSYGPCVTAPVAVPTDLRFTTLQAGGFNDGFTCGITTAGDVVCWGARWYLGSGRPLRSATAADLAALEVQR